MAFIPVPNVLQFNARFILGGQEVQSCMCFSYADNDFETAAANLNGVMQTAWWDTLRTALSNQITHIGNYVVDQASASGPVASFGAFTNPAGQSSIFSAPGNVAFAVTHRTAKRGRSFRGRTYVAGIPADQIASSRVSTGFLGSVVSAFNDMRNAAAGQGVPFVIVSRYTNKDKRITGIYTPVTVSLAVDNVVDSQRRRLPGRGN